ncbi:MAG: PspC domain-containing protein [Alphaproteobacteria bacterium]|nr:PspC domain-containing protein [Alphaproteobacteria bacterium]
MSSWKRERRRQEREAWREKYGAEGEADRQPQYHRRHWRQRERGPFRRYPERGIAFGVVAGVARWIGWSPWAVRGPAIALLVINPPLFFAIYGACWLIMERETVFGWVQERVPSLPDAVPQVKVEDVRSRLRQLEERAARLEARVTSDAFALRRRFRGLDGN